MCHVRTHRPPIPSTHLPFEGHTHILMLAGRGAIEAYASCHRTKRTAANWQQRQQLLQKGRPPEWAPVSENLSIPGIPSIPSHPVPVSLLPNIRASFGAGDARRQSSTAHTSKINHQAKAGKKPTTKNDDISTLVNVV